MFHFVLNKEAQAGVAPFPFKTLKRLYKLKDFLFHYFLIEFNVCIRKKRLSVAPYCSCDKKATYFSFYFFAKR